MIGFCRSIGRIFAIFLAVFGTSGAPLSAQTTASKVQAASQDGTAFGRAAKEAASAIPDQEVSGQVIPGYQAAPDSLSSLFGSSDDSLNSAAGSAINTPAWGLMTDADRNKARIDPASLEDIRARAKEINESASPNDLGGEGLSSSQGTCEEIKKITSVPMYEETCFVAPTIDEKAKVPAYSCPDGWTLNGTTCTLTTVQDATLIYSCPAGQLLSVTTCLSSVPASVTYTCPSGWILSGTTCFSSTTSEATANHTCPTGYTISGNYCYSSIPATPSYSCPNGYTQVQSQCQRTDSVAASITGYVCPPDYALSGARCIKTTTVSATVVYSCPDGWALSGSTCSSISSYNASASYNCPAGGYFDGSKCIVSSSESKITTLSCGSYPKYMPGNTWYMIRADPLSSFTSGATFNYGGTYCTYVNSQPKAKSGCDKTVSSRALAKSAELKTPTYSSWYQLCLYPPDATTNCPAGTTDNGQNMCVRTSSYDPTLGYYCPNGGVLQGSQCMVQNTSQAVVTNTCPAGFVLVGSQCTATVTQNATPIYSCPTGYTLNSTTCNLATSTPVLISYLCPSGLSLVGEFCQAQTETVVQYSCPSGYDLVERSCIQAKSTDATPVYSCSAGQILNGTTCSSSSSAEETYTCPAGFTLSETRCSQTLSQAASQTMVCPEGTSIVDGTCLGETENKSTCNDLEQNSQCTWLRDNCLDEVASESCKVTERVFQCPVPGEQAKEDKEFVCSGDVYCINGSCQTIEREASNELKDALVAMGAIDQTGKEFDPEKMGLFTGSRETCQKPVFGLVNCCAGKVSGLLTGPAATAAYFALGAGPAALAGVATQFLTKFMCSDSEKQLDVKDRLGLCHFVGSYCSSSFLGVCTKTKKAYCCFESKLTRILQEQGRPQINKPWDHPKAEKCEGYTVDEFSRLDMSKMDFSEIYSEFLEAAKLPNEAQMASDIQTKIQAYYKQNATGGK